MSINKIRKAISHNLINLPGWRTKRKLLVVESDDWGSIRMPSKSVYENLIDNGVRVDKDPYCKFDSQATPEDLQYLFEVLDSVKDKNGKSAILTANTIVANPDFNKIKESNYTKYFFEPFTDTLKRDKETENSFQLWNEGISAEIFHPQFHGREHLYVKKWMKDLHEGNPLTRLAFEFGTFGLTSEVDSRIKDNYMGAFNSGLKNDITEYNAILSQGLKIFEELFNYKSLSFIPTTYTWSPEIEPVLAENGVKFLQGMVHQRIPVDDDSTFRYKKSNFTGYRSKSGLIYLSRNAFFEPSQNPGIDWFNDCLRRVRIAFKWNKPAIISTHRLNFIGRIDEKNRSENLITFRKLLKNITSTYPDIEFMSSDQLGLEIFNDRSDFHY